ncbi:hypothetical protein GAMM_40011 [Gammaproteobacteria bacterium]
MWVFGFTGLLITWSEVQSLPGEPDKSRLSTNFPFLSNLSELPMCYL